MPMVCWWHTPPEAGAPGPDGGFPFVWRHTRSGGTRNPLHECCRCRLKLHVAGVGRAQEKGYSESPFPEDRNQLGLLWSWCKSGKQANQFCTTALTARKIFPFRYCVRHISQRADTVRGIPVSGRYRIFHQYKHHATFKTREKGGRHPAFKLQCRITDTGERNWSSLCFFFNSCMPVSF